MPNNGVFTVIICGLFTRKAVSSMACCFSFATSAAALGANGDHGALVVKAVLGANEFVPELTLAAQQFKISPWSAEKTLGFQNGDHGLHVPKPAVVERNSELERIYVELDFQKLKTGLMFYQKQS